MPYDVDGDFGKVRAISHLPTQAATQALDYATSAGWHRCNDRYHICRSGGCDSYLVFFTLGGRGRLTVGHTTVELGENTVGISPPDVFLEYGVPENGLWEFYWMHVKGFPVEPMLRQMYERHGCLISLESRPSEAVGGIEELMLLKNSADQAEFEIMASRIISGILHGLLIELAKAERKASGRKSAVRELIQYLETNYSANISIEAVSRSFYFSPAHLSRLFKAETGLNPYEYLKRYRILKAKELLLYTDLGVKEIANRTGFSQVSNFICQFRALEGLTPGSFRK